MTFRDLVKLFGNKDSAIAYGLGTSRQLVAHWRKKGITKARQAWIREQINGRRK